MNAICLLRGDCLPPIYGALKTVGILSLLGTSLDSFSSLLPKQDEIWLKRQKLSHQEHAHEINQEATIAISFI